MITCLPVEGIGEVARGDDLAKLLVAAIDLRDGDVLVVTSKVVSKAEGQVVTGAREEALVGETDRVVARRGPTSIVRTHHGLVMAAAGIDASNTVPGTLVLLPVDPDASARGLRAGIAADGGPNVAVIVSDTSGRAWRTGQTDIAVGAAGIEVLDDHAGRGDGYGNSLAVTAPALADEITAAADLVTGKLSRSPAAVVRGLGRLVLARGEDGPGASALVRPEAQDMFGLGAREAVVQAASRVDLRGFGQPAGSDHLREVLEQVLPGATVSTGADMVHVALPAVAKVGERGLGALEERACAVAFGHGWTRLVQECDERSADAVLRFTPVTP
ncbi:MAG TPA: coenzyme F420-0:L-glutamate ligase [Nocardioidaceae bacterium]|nr:coenzyme F420-0:L-glutamate ligase [Nocardioidaceae bacterium]